MNYNYHNYATKMKRSFFSGLTAGIFLAAQMAGAADTELTNYNSGIDVTWGGTKGVDYCEEYYYSDKLIDDHKVVYIRDTTTIQMAHNDRNTANYARSRGWLGLVVGKNGRDGVANSGDEGTIRYKIDRDRQLKFKWTQNYAKTDAALRFPAYTGPFRLKDQTFETGVPVVGTTGSNGGDVTSKENYYFRGLKDEFGDEWHVLAYGDDDESFLRKETEFVDQSFYASDGKTVLLVVNPKTPCLTFRVTGNAQFYTTLPKAYWTPKLNAQTTYIDPGSNGQVTAEIRNLYGGVVFYSVNGAAFKPALGASITLPDSVFKAGSNSLRYYYNPANIKTRTVFKSPGFPSASETHGTYLWPNSAAYSKTLSRIKRDPYLNIYSGYKNRGDTSTQDLWDTNGRKGLRTKSWMPLRNAFVAMVEGWEFRRAGATKSHGRYAKEMLLESTRTVDPIGFEYNHSADAIPNREIHYRGYYDAVPVLDCLFAYDIMISKFRSNQVSGGITPIEDLFIRDRLAGFAYEAVQWGAGMNGVGAPGMWGGARMMCGTSIGMILKEYSTSYYGTSGFGAKKTTYPLCPYENDKYTWKAALYDSATPLKKYPNLSWHTGISDNGVESLFMAQDQTWAQKGYPVGTWLDKAAYFSPGLMGQHLMIWANMSKMFGSGKSDPRLEIGIANALSGDFIGAKDPSPQAGSTYTMLLYINERWADSAGDALTEVKSLAKTDPNSDTKAMQDAGVFGFAWYDDQMAATGDVIPVSPKNVQVSGAP